MKCGLPYKELEQLMRANLISDKRYTFDEIWMVYVEIMNRDYFITRFKMMHHTSLRRRLPDWEWLGIEGERREIRYYLAEPEACCQFSEFYQRVNNVLLPLKDIVKGCRR